MPQKFLLQGLAVEYLAGEYTQVPEKVDIVNRVSERFQVFTWFNPYPTAFPYGNGMVLHFYQQQESSTTKTVHKVINKGLKAYA